MLETNQPLVNVLQKLASMQRDAPNALPRIDLWLQRLIPAKLLKHGVPISRTALDKPADSV